MAPAEKLREILFKKNAQDVHKKYDANGKIKAKVQTFDKTQSQIKKIVVAQKTAIGQVQVSTVIVKEEDEEQKRTRPLQLLNSGDGPKKQSTLEKDKAKYN